MKQFYSPFINSKNSFISIANVRFSHIAQLEKREVEEGYQVEYKSQWDANFLKKHLCQTITSFANSEGGWLIVGIENDTTKYIGIKKQRADFSQTISQKLNALVSPIPKFDCRFIRNPKDPQYGVLVIYVYEGINPPYICNGTVYVRNGSSKTPVKPGRIEIDNLIQKREKFLSNRKSFCVDYLIDNRKKIPICSIFLYNPYANIDINSITDKLKIMKHELEDMNHWKRITYSIESIICYNTDIISNTSVTLMSELYANGNVKISCPLFVLPDDFCKKWGEFLSKHNPSIDVTDMKIIDGFISFYSIESELSKIFQYIKKRGYHINDYFITFDYRNVGNTILYFRQDYSDSKKKAEAINKIQANEFYICPKNKIKTEPTYFIEDVSAKDAANIGIQLLGSYFALLFGITPDEINKKITELCSLYSEQTFISQKHYFQ